MVHEAQEVSSCDQIFYDYAMNMVGKPYIWGGDDSVKGYDCSGLIIELMLSQGLIPRGMDLTAQGLFNFFEKGRSVYNRYGFGALVFYGKSKSKITHVGFMLDRHRMLEAGGGGSHVKSEDDAAKYNAYIRIRPVKARTDLVAVVMPFYRSTAEI